MLSSADQHDDVVHSSDLNKILRPVVLVETGVHDRAPSRHTGCANRAMSCMSHRVHDIVGTCSSVSFSIVFNIEFIRKIWFE